jgi:glycosyltransferase involved in cell wall biosynthesis
MVLETGKRLAARGHQVDCVCIRADRAIVGTDSGITFHEIGGTLSSQIPFWLRFRSGCVRVADAVSRILDTSTGETVLFPQVFPANWWGDYVMRKLPNLPCIWYCQEPSAFIHSASWINALPWPKNWIAKALNPLLRTSDLQACRKFTRVLVNSQYSRNYTRLVYGYSEEACRVVYLGFDPTRFRVSMDEQREASIICVAKLTRFKNVDRVIDAMRLLRDGGDDETKLHIVGTGDALPSLKLQVARLGLEQRVLFHGRLNDSDLVRLLQRSKGLCLASVDEPFGLVAIEAMACGTPVIAVDSGGPAEVVGTTAAGILVERPQPESIAKAMCTLLGNSSEFETRSSAALARAADFDWERTVDRLEAEFSQNEFEFNLASMRVLTSCLPANK